MVIFVPPIHQKNQNKTIKKKKATPKTTPFKKQNKTKQSTQKENVM